MAHRLSGHFLRGPAGPLATVLVEPQEREATFAVLHLPAFAEEMNKARRAVALAARELADRGAMVAIVDPRGTGDSGGEHRDATWAGWQSDATCAWQWLCERCRGPRVLWGLRLGALLAADAMQTRHIEPDLLLLWQPVLSGKLFFTQFLRLAVAQQVTAAGDKGRSAHDLRAMLDAGTSPEIAGYDLHPRLVSGAEAVELAAFTPRCPVIWRETSVATPPSLSPAAAGACARWRSAGVQMDVVAVSGPSFWASAEIAEAPELCLSTGVAVSSCLFPHRVGAS